MSETLFAIGDIGGTNFRLGLYTELGEKLLERTIPTDPSQEGSYEASVDKIVDFLGGQHKGFEVTSASFAVAAEVAEDGTLTKSGALTPWVGRNLRRDLANELSMPEELIGTPNDVVAIAISQQHVNLRNMQCVDGIASTLSTGWGGALYFAGGETKSDEPGHEFLRAGATCTCGEDGHAEGWISGGGVMLNHGLDMSTWLKEQPDATVQLTQDIASATLAMIERVKAANPRFEPEEIRWTGGVALNQPFIMQNVADVIRDHFTNLIEVDTVTMGEHAGIHGTFIDARDRAAAY